MLIWKNRYSYQNKILIFLAGSIDLVGRFLFLFQTRAIITPNKIHRVLVIKLDNLGDCFLSLPLFDYLKQLNSDVVIDSLSLNNAKFLFVDNPSIDNCYSIDRRLDLLKPSLVKEIKRNGYDLVIDARGYWQAALFSFLSGCRLRFGFSQEVGQFFYTHLLKFSQNEHETSRYRAVLKILGISFNGWQPRLSIDKISQDKFSALLSDNQKVIAIHPTASLPYKFWPGDYWAELIDFLAYHFNFKVVILGGLDGQPFVDKLLRKIDCAQDKIVDYTGKLSLLESYFLISRADLFIGNDSVLGHFAGALNIPTVVIMNRVIDQHRWSPLGQKTKIFTASKNKHQCNFDKCDYDCQNMSEIKPAEIIDYIVNLKV